MLGVEVCRADSPIRENALTGGTAGVGAVILWLTP
jgi:hypothetical protein